MSYPFIEPDPGFTHGGRLNHSEDPGERERIERIAEAYAAAHPGVGAPVKSGRITPEGERLLRAFSHLTLAPDVRPASHERPSVANLSTHALDAPWTRSSWRPATAVDLAADLEDDALVEQILGTGDPTQIELARRMRESGGSGDPAAEMTRGWDR